MTERVWTDPAGDDRAARGTPTTDVIAFSADYGENGAAGWVYCPPMRRRAEHAGRPMVPPRRSSTSTSTPDTASSSTTPASRAHIACHELGHTLGLRHWGNPPETDGPAGATCMNANTPNGPTTLHETDVDHINAYPYKVWPKTYRLEIVQAPACRFRRHRFDRRCVDRGLADRDADESRGAGRDCRCGRSGRVTDVAEGRRFGSASHALHYAAVTVRIDELLGGGLAPASSRSLILEIPLFDGPESLGSRCARRCSTPSACSSCATRAPPPARPGWTPRRRHPRRGTSA